MFHLFNRVNDVDGVVKNLTDSSCQMKILIDSTARDSIRFISEQDVRLIVNEAADEKTSSYIDQQGNLLTIYAGIMALFALIFTIIVPLLINNRQQDKNDREMDKQKEEFNKYYEKIKDEGEKIGKKLEEYQTSRKQKEEELQRKLDELAKKFTEMSGGAAAIPGQEKVTNRNEKRLSANDPCVESPEEEKDTETKETVKRTEETSADKAETIAALQAQLRSQAVSIIKETKAQIDHEEDLKRIEGIDDSEKRIAEIEDNIAKMPGNPLVRYCELSKLYAEKQDWKKSIFWVESAISLDNEFIEAYIQLAKVLRERKMDKSELQKAWVNIEKALDRSPDEIDALNLRSKILYDLGCHESAKSTAQVVYEIAMKESKINIAMDAVEIIESAPVPAQPHDDINIEIGSVKFIMKRVEGGVFTMGGTKEQGMDAFLDEYPTHKVMLDDYYMGEALVTQELWKEVMGTTVMQQRDKRNGSWPIRGEGNDYPMYYVSWEECREFIQKLSGKTGRKFQLPTEAQWEFAARGGNKSKGYKYSGSDEIDGVAWYSDNSNSKTHPVKSKKPNELGLYDMSGNVWEWCEDWYGNYSSDPQVNPKGPDRGRLRVCLGGGWGDDAKFCRVSRRDFINPEYSLSNLGFRVVLVPSSPQEEKK